MNELQRFAYEHPLTRAASTVTGYFRQIDRNFAVGLTVNKWLDAMEGRPVWLASVSHRVDGAIVPTGRWRPSVRSRADAVLGRLLLGVGDERREVSFRMNVTLCRHRGLTDEEEAGLPADFHDFEATDSAGAAVELLWARGVAGRAHLPCEAPSRGYLHPPGTPEHDPELWLPEPCGECGPCLARAAVRRAA